ncbi:MAG: radical SAM protein, partial [Chloroflexota bacterium]
MRVKNLLNLTGDTLHTLPLLVLYITDGCNSRCVTCDIWHNPRRNMPLALAESIAETCAELGVRWVLISGGEAMQHPEWDTIAQMFAQHDVHVMLLTNGLLLKKQYQHVIDSVDELIVSLDG